MTDTITVDISASFKHSAAIYEPAHVRDVATYTLALPADERFSTCAIRMVNGKGEHIEPSVTASSYRAPIIMIGEGTPREEYDWSYLCERAARYRVPLNALLIDRPLRVACSLWTPSLWAPFSKPNASSTLRQAITLIAVQILGDFTKSQLLDERIAEAKAWFASNNDEDE